MPCCAYSRITKTAENLLALHKQQYLTPAMGAPIELLRMTIPVRGEDSVRQLGPTLSFVKEYE